MYQAQLKKTQRFHKRNLVIEGSCNYFFWMDKIAMVGAKFIYYILLSILIVGYVLANIASL